MILSLKDCEVRSLKAADAASLARHANNRKIWLNLRDAFPHPYSLRNARAFIRNAQKGTPESIFAIAVEGDAVGAIGFTIQRDVERVSAEIGYWLGEPFWGRGITTSALRAVTDHAVRAHHLTRIYAVPYEWNQASFRVLEKAGYQLEGRLRRSAMKDGKIIDQLLYAYLAPDEAALRPFGAGRGARPSSE